MNGHEAFAALVKQVPGWLDRPIEDLVKIAAVGSVYLETHKALLRKIKVGQIELAEEDRKTKLADGQAVGRALLDVEARIGELSYAEPEARKYKPKHHGPVPTGQPQKHERLGLRKKQMHNAQTIARHPEAVAEVIQEAEENEDIPTKTAVLNKIRLDEERAYRKEVEKRERPEIVISLEEQSFIMKLEETVHHCPKKSEIPKNWHEAGFQRACALAMIIYKRLEDLINERKNISEGNS